MIHRTAYASVHKIRLNRADFQPFPPQRGALRSAILRAIRRCSDDAFIRAASVVPIEHLPGWYNVYTSRSRGYVLLGRIEVLCDFLVISEALP